MATVSPPIPQTSSASDRGKRGYEALDWEETPLTHLPRGWSKFYRETAIFLRSIGLGIIVATWEGTFKKNYTEPKKIAVSKNRVRSLLKCLIHLVPVSFALFEIITNFRGRYLGRSFNKQSYYQLVAKTHEILIDASLASIVLSYIRMKTAQHDGLPFGAFLGGLQFLSISYLWSRELWSSVFSNSWRLRTRATFLLLIIVGGIIAATAGPASATLLIPRDLLWKLPSTYSIINATTQEIWPTRLDSTQVPSECLTLNETSRNPLCLAAAWQDIYQNIYLEAVAEGELYNSPKGPFDGMVYGTEPAVGWTTSAAYINCPFNHKMSSGGQVCGSMQANILESAAFSDSNDPTLFGGSFLDLYHIVDSPIYSAYTAVRCHADTIRGPEDASPLQFPSLSRTVEEYEGSPIEIAVETPSKAEVYATSRGNLSELHLLWIDLPKDMFEQAASGAVLLDPRGSDANSLQKIMTCTLSAAWGRSAILKDNSIINTADFFPADIPTSLNGFVVEIPSNPLGTSETWIWPFWGNASGQTFPQNPIEMPMNWLAYLNPTLEMSDGFNTTAINQYMSVLPPGSHEFGAAKIITMMLDAGLSTVGQDLPWESLPNGPVHCDDNCQVIETKHLYQGWAYTSQGISVKLALIILMTYCAFAIIHMAYLVRTGISSDAWDSTAEILALAINSPRTHHLQNTCSGIFGTKAFRTRVRILATAEGPDSQKDHLELVFGEASEATVPEAKMLLNEEYGSLPGNGCRGCGCSKDREL